MGKDKNNSNEKELNSNLKIEENVKTNSKKSKSNLQ